MLYVLVYHDLIGFDAITATNGGAVVSLPQGIMEFGISCECGEKILSDILLLPDVVLSIETSKGLYSNRDIPIWKPGVYNQFPKLPEIIMLYKILASSKDRELYESIESVLTEEA